MYLEEEVSHGELIYRTEPDGDWKAYTKEQLTSMLLAARIKLQEQQREDRLDTAIAKSVLGGA